MDEAAEITWFDLDRFGAARARSGAVWGRPVRVHLETESTNDLALAALDEDTKTGAVWIARSQTRGRGRRGNVWTSKPGENLTCSILLRVPTTRLPGLSLVVGLAVRALVAAVVPATTRATVKWPNDVLVDDRKCAGILIETKSVTPGETGVVVGVGLNVLSRAFPADLAHATSLLLAGARPDALGFEELLACLLVELETRMRTFLPRGLAPLLEELRRHDALVGRAIRVDEQAGIASGFEDDGALRLRLEDGSFASCAAGHVTLDFDRSPG